MAFGAEMKDFIAAFQVGTAIKEKKRQYALDVEQEQNRQAEAANKAAAVESRYNRTMEYNQAGRDYTIQKDQRDFETNAEKTDYDRGRDTKADEIAALKAADEAWAAQIAADPQSGYDPEGNIIPPPSQRGQVQEAIPTAPPAPAGDGRIGPVSSSGMNDLVINHDVISDAVDGGLKRLSQEGKQSGVQAVMDGAGAPSPETVKAIDAIVDPNNEMSEEQKTLARLEATYQFYLTDYKGKDGVERANEAAAQWLQHARGVAAIQATAALALNEQGDMVGAAKQLEKMHKSIPDGRSTTYDEARNVFTVTDDQTGDVIQEGEVTPELIDQIAAGFTKGPAFFQVMLAAAERSKNFNPGAGDKEAKPPKPVTSGELKEQVPLEAEANEEEINAALFGVVSKEFVDIDGAPVFGNEEEFVAQVGEDSVSALSDLAIMISGYNGIDPKEAAKLALVIADPDINVGDPSEQQFDGFKVLPISEKNRKAGVDVMVLQTPDGRELELPGNAATTAIRMANRGLFIAAKAITEKNVGETNQRTMRDNAEYQNEAAEKRRLEEEQRNRAPGMGRRGGAYVPPPAVVAPVTPSGRRGSTYRPNGG